LKFRNKELNGAEGKTVNKKPYIFKHMIQWDLSVETRTTFKHILAERYKKELLRGKNT
jgi:hypothetical protein